jgi:hypothetical protein
LGLWNGYVSVSTFCFVCVLFVLCLFFVCFFPFPSTFFFCCCFCNCSLFWIHFRLVLYLHLNWFTLFLHSFFTHFSLIKKKKFLIWGCLFFYSHRFVISFLIFLKINLNSHPWVIALLISTLHVHVRLHVRIPTNLLRFSFRAGLRSVWSCGVVELWMMWCDVV